MSFLEVLAGREVINKRDFKGDNRKIGKIMIEINNLTKARLDKNFLKKVAKIVLKGENIRTMPRFTRQNSRTRAKHGAGLIQHRVAEGDSGAGLDSSLRSETRKDKGISIVLVGVRTIKKLNQRYRKKNQPTDVLAFGEVLSFPAPEQAPTPKFGGEGQAQYGAGKFQVSSSELGEIVICPEEVKKNAKKLGSTFKKELTFVLIHGILHLLGYDHEKSKKEAELMEKKEEYYLSQV